MTDVSQATDRELMDELKARGYSVLRLKLIRAPITEATAKCIRKTGTPLDEPLTDTFALDLWKAAQGIEA